MSSLLTTKALLILIAAVTLLASLLVNVHREATATATRRATAQEKHAVNATAKIGSTFQNYNPK